MKSLKGTRTAENLMKAFAGESQARNRYTFFASVANKEGYMQIQAIFLDTADNEKEHAKIFYKHLAAGFADEMPMGVDITATYPVAYGTTLDHLRAAAAGENEEWSALYPDFAQVADAEGFPEVSASFRLVSKVEAEHEARYLALAKSVAEGTVFHRPEVVEWRCRNCGFVTKGADAPKECPACKHPQAYFELFRPNY